MNEITLSIDNRHFLAFLSFLQTLDFIRIKKVEKDEAVPANPMSQPAWMSLKSSVITYELPFAAVATEDWEVLA